MLARKGTPPSRGKSGAALVNPESVQKKSKATAEVFILLVCLISFFLQVRAMDVVDLNQHTQISKNI
jgi:hypothetical protein